MLQGFTFFIHWIKESNKHNKKCLSALACFLPKFSWRKETYGFYLQNIAKTTGKLFP